MKPVIIMLALIPLVLTAYAEAPSHVDVYDYPFNITLLEGGNFTLYNNGTSNINMISHGWFDAVAPAGGSVTVQLPADTFFADTYYVQDVMNDSMSTITIEKPTPIYVPPTPSFISTSNGTSDTFEPIVQPTAPPVYAETMDEPTDMTTYNDLMVIPPPIPYCDNDPEWCAELERLEQANATSNETTVVIESDSNTEVLNLRLQILKVIESIFKIVLQ
jgi:hypothetical protein